MQQDGGLSVFLQDCIWMWLPPPHHVKNMLPLVMDDGHFAHYVQRNYDINAIASNTDDQDLQANLTYWKYDDDNRSALKSDLLGFVRHYRHVKPKSAETEKDDDKSKSSDDDDDEERPAAKEPDDVICPKDDDKEVMVEDNTNVSPSKCFYTSDENFKLPDNKMYCKLMTVDDGWRDKSVVKIQTKPSLKPSLTYKVLYPHLYCDTCNADCYICVYNHKYIAAHSKGEGWYDTEFINIFARLLYHLSHSPSITKKKSVWSLFCFL